MRFLHVFALCLALSSLASANMLTLNPVTTNHQYQQTVNHPCIIGDPSCNQPASFPLTVFPEQVSSYDSLSPLYTVAQITAIAGSSFMVGVDINDTHINQTLSLFEMIINGAVVDTYSANPATSVPPTVGGGNGNGYADYTLGNFTSLAGYSLSDTVQFHVVMPVVNDGREEFFLISNGVQPVPEPVSVLLAGAGLAGIGLVMRRRKRSI